jgi:hypothetical protein
MEITKRRLEVDSDPVDEFWNLKTSHCANWVVEIDTSRVRRARPVPAAETARPAPRGMAGVGGSRLDGNQAQPDRTVLQ